MAPGDQTIHREDDDDHRPTHDGATIDSERGHRAPGQPPQAAAGAAFAAVRDGLEKAGDQVGPYKLLSLIGEGGFGTVWLAERREPFVQRVALKVVKAGMDSKSVLARFEQERQALAVMNHPGIAKVLDGGLTPAGRPFFAMEYVKGEPVTQFCDRMKLGIEERLKLFEQACEAIQHAHLKGIVHRDVKPSNILAFMVEGEGPKLKVIDFGVAKAMSQRMTDHTIFTETGQMIGTPEYMSPEQADPTAGDIDTRSDIYSLGVLLYELLTGSLPFNPVELRKKAYGEIQRTIREIDPPVPSVRVSTIATKDRELAARIESARNVRASELARRLRSELEWIPLKAMRKEPQHRYQTAIEFARDVRDYLDGKPIMAAPESTGYRIRKYVRRNRALVVGAGAVLAALVIGLGLAAWQWREAVAATEQAIAAKDVAQASEAKAVAERVAADAARQDAEAAKDAALASEARAKESESRATAQLERSNDLLGVITTGTALDAVRRGDVAGARHELAVLKELGRDDRFAARLAAAWSDQSLGEPLRGHEAYVFSVAFSPDGKTLASGSYDNTIRLWDAATGKPLGEPLRGHEGWVTSVAFSPDGKTLASGSEDKTIRLWDAATGKPLGEPLRGHEDYVISVAFSPDGKTLASGSWDDTIRLWDAATGKPLGEPLRGHGERVDSVAFSPDGKTLASGSRDKTIRLWDAATGKPLGEPLRGNADRVNVVAFSPDGKTLASGSETIRLWDAATGKPLGEPLRGLGGWVYSVAFSPDGKTLASGNSDKTIRLWDAATGKPLGEPLRGHENYVISVAFSSDGKTLASGSKDDTIRLWDVAASRPLGEPLNELLRGYDGEVNGVAFSPDGKTLASGSEDDTIRLWDAATGQPLGEPLRGHERSVTSVAFSPDGKTFASGSGDQTIRLWDAATGKPLGEPLRGHESYVTGVAFSPDGKTLASGSEDKTIRLWSGVPMRDRVLLYRTRMAQVERVRVQLAERIARVDDTIDSVQALGAEVRADPRFTGDLRTAALLVVGEVDVARQEVRTQRAAEAERKRADVEAARRERLKPLEDALNKKDWALALQLVAAANPDDLAMADASFWNALVWRGLTELLADSPGRDLKQLLTYAERAVALSERKEGTILDTLARAHWELGDKAKALEVQREAIAALTAQIAAAPADTPAETKQERQTMLAELQATLEKYEREQPPAPPVAPPAP